MHDTRIEGLSDFLNHFETLRLTLNSEFYWIL